MGWRKISVESWDKLWCENPENKDSMPNCHHTSDIRSILKHNGYNISSKLLNQQHDHQQFFTMLKFDFAFIFRVNPKIRLELPCVKKTNQLASF